MLEVILEINLQDIVLAVPLRNHQYFKVAEIRWK